MIDYSKYMSYEEFKEELIKDRFFCKSDKVTKNYKIIYEKLETDYTITQEYVYKLSIDLIKNKEYSFKCDINSMYNGKINTDSFKRCFLKSIYNSIDKKKDASKFLESLDKVFDCIFKYPKEKILDMYVINDFDEFNNLVIETDIVSDRIYKFTWDVIGYAFGKLQLNIGANKNHIKILKECGFTEEELKSLTNVKAKDNKISTIKKLNKAVENLNPKLYRNKNKIDNYCKNIISKSISRISNYDVIKKLKFENEVTFIHLIDYDNQFYFSNNSNGYTLYKILKNKINNNDLLLKSKDILDFKLKTEYGKNNSRIIKNRYNNINNNIKPVLKNVDINQINDFLTDEIILDAITLNETSYYSNYITTYNLENKYKQTILDDLLNSKINVNKVEIENEDELEDEKSFDEQVENINTLLEINLKDVENNPLNAYKISEMIIMAKKIFNEFLNKHNKNSEIYKRVKSIYNEFNELCTINNNCRNNLEKCYKKIEELNNKLLEIKVIVNNNNDEFDDFNLLSSYFNSLYIAYGYMKENEFAKYDLLATGIIDETNEFILSTEDSYREFADSFISKKPSIISKEENRQPDFLSIFFKNNKFLYMKEADYRSLEAALRQSHRVKPDKFGCRRIWILIYILFNLIARKNVSNSSDEDDFINHASKLFNEMKNKNWRHSYSNIEKTFSMAYPFVTYSRNPFTNFMNDKGFNESQEISLKLRDLIEQERVKLVDSLKEFVYGDNKIYDIFQGIADIMYELSSPITLYTDFDIYETGESIVNQFINACVTSLEMQTAMAIYDFIFNFKIKIGKDSYSLNDLNNMLKTFNLIVNVSKSTSFTNQVINREKLCRNTSYYNDYKRLGFLTYNKEWNEKFLDNKDIIKDLTGFYLSDERDLYDLVEYCRKKPIECYAGDLRELTARFQRLNYYEWLSSYISHRLRTKDKNYSFSLQYDMYDNLEHGYLRISSVVESFNLEANNEDASVTYINPYIENIANYIIAHPEELDEYKNYCKEMFRRFRVNMIKNEKKLVSFISNEILDNKVDDWLMKMIPTYQMIAEAFGFSEIAGIETLDRFINNLMNVINLNIKLIFDKWKRNTVEVIETRRIQFIEKERYYYIQSFPVMIDWVMKNLEYYLTMCDKYGHTNDIQIDLDKYYDNLDKIDDISKTFIMKLKEELGCMSSIQLKEFETKFKETIYSIEGINKNKADELLKSMSLIYHLKDSNVDVDLTFLNNSQLLELLDKLKDIL